jgi:DNA polymerase V
MNPAFPTLYPETLTLFGVVMHFIHNTRTRL